MKKKMYMVISALLIFTLAACSTGPTATQEPCQDETCFPVTTEDGHLLGAVKVEDIENLDMTTANFYPAAATLPMLAAGQTTATVYELTATGISATVIGTIIAAVTTVVYQADGGMRQLAEGPDWISYDGRLVVNDMGRVTVVDMDAAQSPLDDTAANSSANITDETASHQPPPDWKPPKQDYCGEDIKEYFVLLAMGDMYGTVMRASGMDYANFVQTPLWANSEQFDARYKEITDRMKKNKCYKYSEGGSIYGDYKLMRNRFWKVDGAEKAWIKANITPDTPTAQAFELYKQLINTWGW